MCPQVFSHLLSSGPEGVPAVPCHPMPLSGSAGNESTYVCVHLLLLWLEHGYLLFCSTAFFCLPGASNLLVAAKGHVPSGRLRNVAHKLCK